MAVPGSLTRDHYGKHMRRHHVLAAAMAGALLISACSSDTGAKRTVVVTVSSGADASGSADASGATSGGTSDSAGSAAPGSDSVASGSAASGAPLSGESVSGAPVSGESAAASPSPSAVAPAPFVVVDPLKADCAAILSAADLKKILNADVPNDRLKINVAEVNADRGQTGRVRCLYGLAPDRKSGAFTIALTTYTDPTAAQKQVDVTVQNEADNSGQVTPVTVSGYPATVALRDGGLIIMAYDNWTMAIATSTPVDPPALQAGLPPLAEAVLARILKG